MGIKLTLALLLLASVASAEQESLAVGQYNVAFDLGNVGPYSTDVSKNASSFLVKIAAYNSSAAVMGYEASDANLDTAGENVLDFLGRINYTDVEFYTRAIDGQMAVLGVSSPADKPAVFIASYPKYLGAYGTAFYVILFSKFPWDEGTKSLLDTLQVDYTPWSYSESQANISKYGTPYYGNSDRFIKGHVTYKGYITFSNNSGESIEDAIVIHNAKTDMEGVDSEYYYLEERFGKKGVDWDLDLQSLSNAGDRNYDVMEITLSDGRKLTIYFDITDFFGKF